MDKHLVKLVIGDWSNDGHNISESIIIASNLTSSKMNLAYIEGTKLVGFDLSTDCCTGYQDGKLQGQYIKKLREVGIKIYLDGQHDDPNKDEEEGVDVTVDEFNLIYLEICKLGNTGFIYDILAINEIDLGGYGLM